jgi:hypothetical protein
MVQNLDLGLGGTEWVVSTRLGCIERMGGIERRVQHLKCIE